MSCYLYMSVHEVFEPDYWANAAQPLPSLPVAGGRLSADMKSELKAMFSAAVANLKVGGPVQPFDAESTLDWNSFDPGTILLLDQESMYPGKPYRVNPKSPDGTNVFDDIDHSARGALLRSNILLTGPLRIFTAYTKSGFDPEQGLRYNRYINLAAVLPGRKGGPNRALDFSAQIQTDQRNRVIWQSFTGFRLPAVLGQASLYDGEMPRRIRIREGMVCHTGTFETAKKPARALGKFALSRT